MSMIPVHFLVQVFMHIYLYAYAFLYVGTEWPDSTLCMWLALVETVKKFFKVVVPVYTRISSLRIPHPSQIWYCQFL